MPTPKDVKSTEGWTLSDQVEELRGKYHLKGKDSEAYRESSQADIRKNDHIIATARLNNWQRRVELAQHENGDEQVIKSVFKNDRTLRLSLQRKTAPGAIEEMDQRMCEVAKAFNQMMFERERRERRMQELRTDLKRMHYIERKSLDHLRAEQSVTMVENSLDKALIKYDTARIISRRYEEILQKLKEESLTLPAKLDKMEQALLQQRTELRELKSMSRDAHNARDECKKQLTSVEIGVYEWRKQRDVELNETRKEVERRKTEAEKVERRHARATLILDNQDQKAQMELQMKKDMQQKLLSYEDAYRRIKEATHVTDMEEVVGRVLLQREKQDRLKTQVAGLESQRNRLLKNLEQMKKSCHHMKYSGDLNTVRGQQMLDSVQSSLDEQKSRAGQLDDSLERAGTALINVRSGVSSFLNKLDHVMLPPPEHNYTQGDVFEQLELTRKKLEQLIKELGVVTSAAIDKNLQAKVQTSDFQDYLEQRLPEDNVRIKTVESEVGLSALSEFDFDGQETEQAPSRQDIKKLGQKIMDAKMRPRKKKIRKK